MAKFKLRIGRVENALVIDSNRRTPGGRINRPGRAPDEGKERSRATRTSAVAQRVFIPDRAGWWHIGFVGKVKGYRQITGFSQIYQLLLQPGREVSVSELGPTRTFLRMGIHRGGLEALPYLTEEEEASVRKNVHSTIRYALQKLFRRDRGFARHLRESIKLALRCSYQPSERAVDWNL